MISQLHILHYRKLQNLDLSFSDTINFISGPNGTCKSSILHIISNAFQEVKSTSPLLADKKSMANIRGLNALLNPKIETLTKGDKKYQNPAHGVKGTLYTVVYKGGKSLNFRRHNSKTGQSTMRYAVKPSYTAGTTDRLPQAPVIYLGLPRLFPYGEFQNESAIEKVRRRLPERYQTELTTLYSELAHLNISNPKAQRIRDVKPHPDFDTSIPGVDSNTISSGEENLYIILTALVSLKYFYEEQIEQDAQKKIGSVLLIDEFDATLHPSMQEQLLNKIVEYSEAYKIQVISTTHSLSLIEYILKKKWNLLYLRDDIERVRPLDEPDIYKIQMSLRQLTRRDIFENKCIPVFTEDEEARDLLARCISHFAANDASFAQIASFFHLVDANVGAEQLQTIFSDIKIRSILGMFCVLDGDHSTDLKRNIISLPGKNSPEKYLYAYAQELYEKNVQDFWEREEIEQNGYDRVFFRDKIMPGYNECLRQGTAEGKSLRELLKKFYQKNIDFFRLIFGYWINDKDNLGEIQRFKCELVIMFKKTAMYHGINPHLPDTALQTQV